MYGQGNRNERKGSHLFRYQCYYRMAIPLSTAISLILGTKWLFWNRNVHVLYPEYVSLFSINFAMKDSKVNESLDEEVQYVKTVSHRRDSEVLWIKTQEARATSPNVISNNEKVSIKTEVVNSNIIEHKKPISKSGSSKKVYGPYERDVCLKAVNRYMFMLKSNKSRSKEWGSEDEKWLKINCHNLRKALEYIDKHFVSGQMVSSSKFI